MLLTFAALAWPLWRGLRQALREREARADAAIPEANP
jgi:hypothetical protein